MLDDAEDEDEGVKAQTLAAALAEGGEEARKEAVAFFDFVRKSTNVPGALKRIHAVRPSARFASAASKVVSERMTQEEEPDEILAFWTLVWVAAHARPELLDELETTVGEAWDATGVIDRVRKTPRGALVATPGPAKAGAAKAETKKAETRKAGAAKPGAPKAGSAQKSPAKGPVRPPEKVSEVKAWLAAHPGIDPAVLARRAGQKAAESAAAVRALGVLATPEALDALVTYRPAMEDGTPRHEGRFGDTFQDAVAKEIMTAWGRFDRRLFAERMFSGLGTLWIGHVGPAEELTGLDVAGLTSLWIWLSPSCDLSPLARCAELARLKVNLHDRTGGLEPVARMPALEYLEIYNSGTLAQGAVDAVASAARVRSLAIAIGPTIDLGTLASMPALERIQISAEDRPADGRTVDAIRALLDRGVEIGLYSHEKWPLAASKALGDVTVVEVGGRLALTRDASRAGSLRSRLSLGAFLE